MNIRNSLKALRVVFFIAIMIASVLAIAAPVSANQIWASDAGGMWKDLFGEDEIVYVTGDLDPTEEDFIFPTARIYVTKNQEWSKPAGLTDVTAGGYNVITGYMLGGGFLGEIVWLPPLTRGRYDLVIDEDQNGRYDGIDYVLGIGTNYAFQVGEPVGVTIDVAAIKNRAEEQYNQWNGLATKWHWVSDSSTAISIGWSIISGDWVSTAVGIFGAITGLPTDYNSGILNIGGKVITGLAAPLAAHWDSLHKDPPDPDYTEFATIDMDVINSELATELASTGISAAYPFTLRGNTSYEVSQIDLANNMARQAALISALQSSIEKYRSAKDAGNDQYIYLQARAVKEFSDMLITNLNDTKHALERYKAEQINHGWGNSIYDVSEIRALQDRLATTGLTPDEIEDLKDSGFSDADITAMIDRVVGQEIPSEDFTRAGTIEDIIASIDDSIPDFQDLSNQAQAVMDDIGPYVLKHHPIAVPGGPYTGDEGSPITFDGTGSSDPDGDALTYEWDFDLDGDFDDASGAIVTWTWNSEFSGMIGLKVTDPSGLSDIAYTSVTVSSVNDPPIIDSFTPADLEPTASQSSPLDFSVTAHDPDGDPLSYSWTLDGVEVSTDTTWTYTPGAGESGLKVVMVTISDGNPLSLDTIERRVVTVVAEVGNQPPVADPNGPYTGQVGVPVTLDGSGSYDPDPAPDHIVSYEWDLDNDGEYDDATGEIVSYIWDTEGTYTIGLKVTDTYGATGIAATMVKVTAVVAPCCDLDNDNDCDYDDFMLFVGAFGKYAGQEGFIPKADYDGDGRITLVDYQKWYECYKDYMGLQLAWEELMRKAA